MGGGSAHMQLSLSVSFSIHPSLTNLSRYLPRLKSESPRERPSGLALSTNGHGVRLGSNVKGNFTRKHSVP
jgi:hypothetical protein